MEVAQRLVQHQQPRAGGERSDQRDPLHLAAGQRARPVPGPVDQPDQGELSRRTSVPPQNSNPS
jgi:hypothetical protein